MALLSLQEVSYSYNNQPLIDKATLHIEAGDKVCLIGRNGAGKTTLMKLINGDIQPEEGTIAYQKGVRCARLDQEIPAAAGGTIYDVVATGLGDIGEKLSRYKHLSEKVTEHKTDELIHELAEIQHEIEQNGGWDLSLKTDKIISLLSLDPTMQFNDLSVGLKRRVLLGKALITDPDILILDEPTNHLDLDAIMWLENFLQQYRGTLFFITHDRTFLKKIADRIVYLDRGTLKSYTCRYEEFLQKKEEELEVEERANEVFDKKLAQEEKWIRQGLKARRRRNEGRVKALLKMRDVRAKRREVSGKAVLETQKTEMSGKLVIRAKNVSFAYDEAPIINDFTTIIARGDKVGIIGPNGCGKSTLLNVLLGNLEPQAGTVRLGTNVEIAYFDQTRLTLDEDKTLWENIGEGNDTIFFNDRPRHVISYLEDFLFTPYQVKSFVSSLSGGEKNRLLLAKLFTKPANILILDEPTNDLDIETLELLEEMLINYTGTILMVSHDREFLNNVVSDVVVFEGAGVVRKYVGGYDDWRNAVKQDEAPEETAKDKKGKGYKPKTTEKKKLSFKEKRELEELPGKIESLEAEQAELFTTVEDPAFYKGAPEEISRVQNRLEELEKTLAELYERWEALEAVEG